MSKYVIIYEPFVSKVYFKGLTECSLEHGSPHVRIKEFQFEA